VVEVYFAEEKFVDLVCALDVDGVEGVLHGFDELGLVHDAFAAVGVGFLAVEALDGQLAEVLLYAEVDLGGGGVTNYLKVTIWSLSLS
jgi:hypothetical protein